MQETQKTKLVLRLMSQWNRFFIIFSKPTGLKHDTVNMSLL